MNNRMEKDTFSITLRNSKVHPYKTEDKSNIFNFYLLSYFLF